LNSEGYHNFHHEFPSDYRNGVKWYAVGAAGRCGCCCSCRVPLR
jgi:hypothetical protein